MQCGAACLSMINIYYKGRMRASEISELCVVGKNGISIAGIEKAAAIIGFKTDSYMLPIYSLKNSTLPAILHWNQNHFVVLYKILNGKKFYIADPGKGLVCYSREEFKKHWIETCQDNSDMGVAMFLQPTLSFYEKNNTYTATREKSFKFLMGYIKLYKKYFVQIFLGMLVGCLMQLVLPFLTQNIVDIGIKNKDIHVVWLILIGQIVITVSKTSVDFIRRWLLLHISMRINISLISDFFIKLLQLPMSFFETKLIGDLMQRIGDHSRVNSFLTQHILNLGFSLISFVVFSCILLVYNKFIFFIFLFGSALYGGWMMLFLRHRKIIDYELFEQQAINNNKTYQFLTSMQEIKLQGCERRRRWEWEDVQVDLCKIQMKSLKLQQMQEAGSILINELKNIIITVVSSTAVIDGNLTLGMMLSVQYIIGQLNSPIEQLMLFIYSIQDVRISLERINEIHKKGTEEDAGHTRVRLGNSHNIELSHVDFNYDPHALGKTIEDVSIHIPEGMVTAIVGASGSGKTTLIKLILGYYPVMNGQINIAGHGISEYNMKWWRSQCGVVMQEGVIFSESIARNIAIDDDKIDRERLIKAAKIACIHEYIMGLPLKYDTKIGSDGVGLSQGQKQRILIARAVYKNPDYIFLDEATNSLDANNERMIVEHLDEFYKGKTVVIVAHRLSTVENADQIVVLDKGKVMEIGNHIELIEKRGVYYNLVRNQLELGD